MNSKDVERDITDYPSSVMGEGRSGLNNQLVPPNNLAAEQALLGSILIENDQFEHTIGELGSNDFYQHKHRVIFEAIKHLYEKKQAIDIVTLDAALEKTQELDHADIHKYLLDLANETPYALNASTYVTLVRDTALLRNLLVCARKIQQMVFSSGPENAVETLGKAQKLIYDASSSHRAFSGLKHIGFYANEVLSEIEELYENPSTDRITGVASGFVELDEMTAGFQKSDLVIIAGRPGMGKTALALNIAEHAAIHNELKVAIFSLEMDAKSLLVRSLSSLSSIGSKMIRQADFVVCEQADMNWKRLANAINLLEKARILIDDTSGMKPLEISARARRMARSEGLDLVIVDYLQLLQTENKEINRVTEIGNITRELKFLAKELEIPVIVLSQLSRAVETRTEKRPVMADLRDSGTIEQDADLILFVYRDQVYHRDSKDENKAEIIIAKHRNGDTGRFKLRFLKEYTRFANLANFEPLG